MTENGRAVSPAAADRREAVLAAARNQFAVRAYEQVGLREIGAEAGVDPTQIVREFGSKEQLFSEAMLSTMPPPLKTERLSWPEQSARTTLLGDPTRPIRVLEVVIHSISSPVAGELIRADINKRFLNNLKQVVEDGPDRAVRIALSASVIMGVTAVTKQFRMDALQGEGATKAIPWMAGVLALLQKPPEDEDPAPSARPFGAAETRAAILHAAKAQFAELGYEHATVRGIATAANADPALVIRYFGSKEALFLEVIKNLMPQTPTGGLSSVDRGEWLARQVVHGGGENQASLLHMTLRSVSSPVAQEVVRQDLEERLFTPLAATLEGADAAVRSALILSIVLGVTLARDIVGIEVLRQEPERLFGHLIRIFRFLTGEEPTQG